LTELVLTKWSKSRRKDLPCRVQTGAASCKHTVPAAWHRQLCTADASVDKVPAYGHGCEWRRCCLRVRDGCMHAGDSTDASAHAFAAAVATIACYHHQCKELPTLHFLPKFWPAYFASLWLPSCISVPLLTWSISTYTTFSLPPNRSLTPKGPTLSGSSPSKLKANKQPESKCSERAGWARQAYCLWSSSTCYPSRVQHIWCCPSHS